MACGYASILAACTVSPPSDPVQLQGYNGQKASFSRTIHVKQVGHALLHIDAFDEDHFITLPSLHIESLIYGSPFVELDKSTAIVSSSGFVSKIDYSGRGWMSGKKNSFTATLSKVGDHNPLYSIEGQWNDSFVIREGSSKKGPTVDTWNGKQPTTKLYVAPIDEQDPRESKRAWKKVVDGIVAGNMDKTSAEKSKIEHAQRELRKKEQAEVRFSHSTHPHLPISTLTSSNRAKSGRAPSSPNSNSPRPTLPAWPRPPANPSSPTRREACGVSARRKRLRRRSRTMRHFRPRLRFDCDGARRGHLIEGWKYRNDGRMAGIGLDTAADLSPGGIRQAEAATAERARRGCLERARP